MTAPLAGLMGSDILGPMHRLPSRLRHVFTFLVLSPAVALLGCPPQLGEGGGTPREICDDGIDNDEDGEVDEGTDADGDGWLDCGVENPDCNDADADVHPGADEVCDGEDNDCDGEVDEDWGGECDGDDDDSVVDPPDPDVILVEVNPEPEEDSFFYRSDLWFEFNAAPEVVSIALADEAGSLIAGTQSESFFGRLVTFDPDARTSSRRPSTRSRSRGRRATRTGSRTRSRRVPTARR